jgi:glycosyltransferase involved in cell wall biosynthesis
MIRPFFSIIIPTYNSAITLEDCLRSILSQTFKNYEILILDCFSSDNTFEIIKAFKDERIKILSEKDNGIYDAMNKGIMISKADWLYFLGSDDKLFDKNVLKDIYLYLSKNTVDILYGDVIFKSNNKKYLGEFNLEKLLLERRNICHQSIFYNKLVFKENGNYNLKYEILADYDFNIRMFLNEKLNKKYLDRKIAIYNDQGISSKKVDLIFRDDLIKNYVLKNYSTENVYHKMVDKYREVEYFKHELDNQSVFYYLKKSLKIILINLKFKKK